MKKQKGKTYTESINEYQNKIYQPGAYTDGTIHPALKAKTKVGGYGMLVAGVLLFIVGFIQLMNPSLINMGGIFHFFLAILLIIVGIKFLKQK